MRGASTGCNLHHTYERWNMRRACISETSSLVFACMVAASLMLFAGVAWANVGIWSLGSRASCDGGGVTLTRAGTGKWTLTADAQPNVSVIGQTYNGCTTPSATYH